MKSPSISSDKHAAFQPVRSEQYVVLKQIEVKLEAPMFVLSLLWACLLAVELIWGLGAWLQATVTAIWIVFLLEFAVRLVISPDRFVFLRHHWLSAFALFIPALRIFRVTRVVRLIRYGRAMRGLTLARVLTAFNRGLVSLRRTMGRFGVGYLFGLTALVTILGAAGMLAFERQHDDGLHTFGDALWFTAMMITTSGSEYWPKTTEGRVLCFLIALYAFAVFGYVTATIAALLLGRKPASADSFGPHVEALEDLRKEVALLRKEVEDNRR
jgi:voltage-gated potassium channel